MPLCLLLRCLGRGEEKQLFITALTVLSDDSLYPLHFVLFNGIATNVLVSPCPPLLISRTVPLNLNQEQGRGVKWLAAVCMVFQYEQRQPVSLASYLVPLLCGSFKFTMTKQGEEPGKWKQKICF